MSSYDARGYNGSIILEIADGPNIMLARKNYRCAKCRRILDSNLVERRELRFCYHCREKLR